MPTVRIITLDYLVKDAEYITKISDFLFPIHSLWFVQLMNVYPFLIRFDLELVALQLLKLVTNMLLPTCGLQPNCDSKNWTIFQCYHAL